MATQGTRVGHLYYTLGIDRAQLNKIKQELRAIAKAARQIDNPGSGGPSKTLPKRFKEAKNEAQALAVGIARANRELKQGKSGFEKYERTVTEAWRALGKLENEFLDASEAMSQTAAGAKAVESALNTVSGAMKQAEDGLGQVDGGVTRLGHEFNELKTHATKLGVEMRTLKDEFIASGGKDAAKFEASLERLAGESQQTELRLMNLRDTTKLTADQQLALSRALKTTTANMKYAQQEANKVRGSYRGMAMGAQMSLGATTLLNDRIFQLSPALGILTNQLMFTTQGLRGFMTAALPVIAVAGSLIAVIGGLYASLKAGVGLEKALEDVRKTTNLTDAELRQLTDTVQELSTELPIATDELLEIARVAGQLGITGVKNIEDFTETIAKLSVATDVTGEQGATNLARFLQATGTEMDKMGGVALQVGNVLNRLENTTAATAAEILKMTSYTQGLASQAGATRTEILGINAAITSLGVKAEAGGSAVVRIVDDIQQAAVNGGNQLANFAEQAGMTTDQFQALVENSPIEALVALSEGLGEAAEEGQSLSGILTDLGIVEVRERRTLLALAQGHETLKQAIHDANMEAIEQLSLNEEVEIQANTISARLQRLGNRVVALGQDIGTYLLPALGLAVDALSLLADGLIAAGRAHMRYFEMSGLILGRHQDLDEALEDTQEQIDMFAGRADAARDSLASMADVTSESGLVGVLQRFSASIDDEARPALSRFVQSTVEPLLAQGKLKDAIRAVIDEMAEYEVAQRQLEVNETRTKQTLAKQEYDMARERLESAQAGADNLESSGVFQGLDAAGRDAMREGRESALEEAKREFDQASSDLESLNTILDTLEGQLGRSEDRLERIRGMTSLEEMRAFIRDELGINIPGGDNPPPGEEPPGGDRDPIQEVYDSITNWTDRVGPALMEANAISGRTYYEELMGILESAIRDGAELGISNDVLSEWQSWLDTIAEQLAERGDLPVEIEAEGHLLRFRKPANEGGMITDWDQRRENEQLDLSQRIAAGQREYDRRRASFSPNPDARPVGIQGGITESRNQALRDEVALNEEAREAVQAHDEAVASLEERFRTGLIDAEELLAGRISETRDLALAMIEIRGEESEAVAELVAELERLERQQRIMNSEQRRGAVGIQGGQGNPASAALLEEVELQEEARKETQRHEAAMADWQARAEALGMDTIPKLDGAIRLQEQHVERMAEVWGWESEAVRELIKELDRLERRRRVAEREPRGGGVGRQGGIGAPWESGPTSMPSQATSQFHKWADAIGEVSGALEGLGADIADTASVVFSEIGNMVDGSVSLEEGIGNAATAIASLLPAAKSTAGQIMEGFFGAAGAVAEFATGIPGLGKLISGVGSIFTRVLGDMSNGIKQMDELVKSTAESSRYLSESVIEGFRQANTSQVSRDGVLGWLGFTKEGMTEEARKMFDRMVEVGSEVASGFANAFQAGIDAFLAGDADWKHTLGESIKSTILNSVIQAFIQTAVMKGVFQDFFMTITEMIANGDEKGAIAYANRVLPQLMPVAEGLIERFLGGIPDDMLPDDDDDGVPNRDDPDTGNKGDSGTRISNITGPTRDLLEDLLRPLNAMQSWTSMIRDIRNDVSRIANATNSSLPAQPRGPQIIVRRDAWMYGKGPDSDSNVTIQNATITTNATDARSMARQISRFTHKERRGGK